MKFASRLFYEISISISVLHFIYLFFCRRNPKENVKIQEKRWILTWQNLKSKALETLFTEIFSFSIYGQCSLSERLRRKECVICWLSSLFSFIKFSLYVWEIKICKVYFKNHSPHHCSKQSRLADVNLCRKAYLIFFDIMLWMLFSWITSKKGYISQLPVFSPCPELYWPDIRPAFWKKLSRMLWCPYG